MSVQIRRFVSRTFLASVLSLVVISAQAQQKLFYPAGDAAAEISAALSSARKDGRHVLLDFGADWCPDCRVLGSLLEQPAVAAIVEANFHVVRIDVGRRDKNANLVAQYGATSGDWIPAIVVLAPDGTRIAVTTDAVRVTRRTTADELIGLLKAWAPKQRHQAFAAFTERGVRVSLSLDRDRSGGLWIAGAFVPALEGTHLYATDLPVEGIQGLGRPTRLHLAPGSSITTTGPAVADRAVIEDRIDQLGVILPVYPAGAVTVRVPVTMDRNAESRADILVSYMACGTNGCLPPVTDRRVSVRCYTPRIQHPGGSDEVVCVGERDHVRVPAAGSAGQR